MVFPESRILNPESFFKERDRFALWIPVLLGTGVGWYFALYDEPPLWLAVLAVGLLAVAAYQLRRRFIARIMAIACLIVAVGFMAACIRTHLVATSVIYGELYYRDVTGRIDDIQDREKGEKLILTGATIERLPANRTPARISVTLRKDVPELTIGDRIALKATLFSPPAPAMPGSYDFTRALYYDGIGAVGYSVSAPEVLEHGKISGASEWLNEFRLSLARRIGAPMKAENGPVAAALMVGEQSAVPKDIGDAMRDAGIYHVLSISGLHMSIAVALLYFSIRFLLSLYPTLALRIPTKKIAAGIGLVGAFAYLLLAGYPVPAVRSFVMVACVMLAILFDRRGISLYSLAWAATLILLFEPDAIFGASFQLSFAATFAIIAFYERYSYLIYESAAGIWRKLWLYFFGLIITSLVATFATTPLVIYHFNRFTIWGIAANALMIPLASFWIMPAAVLALIAMPFGLEYWPLIWLDHGISLMVEGSRWVAGFSQASFAVPSPTFWGIALVIYGGLWFGLWRQRWRLLGLPLMVIGMMTVVLHEPYDLLISDDATKVAVRLPDGEFLFVRGRPSSFDGQVWLRAHGKEDGLTLSDVDEKTAQCDGVKCILELRGKRIVVAQHKKETQGLCQPAADIVISDNTLEDAACSQIPLVIDRQFLWQSGAVGIRVKDSEIEMRKVEDYRGNRPWVSRRPLRALPNGQTLYKE